MAAAFEITMGTRGSALALAQSRQVARTLEKLNPGLTVREEIIRTTGDKITDVPLARIGGKGLFIKEIEEALAAGKVDFAVHSMKDVPAELPRGFEIACVPEREDPRDALCSTKAPGLEKLPRGARIGTSSLRRKAQLMAVRPDLKIEDLRGNVDTRLSRLDEGRFDAILLAAAGLRRLGLAARITESVGPALLLPAVGQGALALETRIGDQRVQKILAPFAHEATRIVTDTERGFLARLEGGCQVPIAGHATLVNGKLRMEGLVADLRGERVIRRQAEGTAADAVKLGRALAEEILKAGGGEILREVYEEQGAQ